MMAQQRVSFREKRPHNIIKSNISRLRKPVASGKLSMDSVKMIGDKTDKSYIRFSCEIYYPSEVHHFIALTKKCTCRFGSAAEE